MTRQKMILERMKAGEKPESIAADLGILVRSVYRAYRKQRLLEEGSQQSERRKLFGELGLDRREMTPEAVQDAERLKKQVPKGYNNLTALICGDPLPGRSALDRRKSA